MVVFGHIGYIPAKLFFSGKMVVIGQSGCVRLKVVVFGKIGCIPAKWYLGKVVVFGKKFLFLGKSGCI